VDPLTEDARATTVLLVGALLIRLSISGAHARYVRIGLGPWLLVAGVLLVALGLAGVIRALRTQHPRRDHAIPVDTKRKITGHGEEHGHGERVGWLLLAPVLALLLVTPPALGSFGVDRNTTVGNTSVKISEGGKTFDSLPPGRTVAMTILEFDQRAADHNGASFGATPVRLTGFVARTSDRDGFRVARYQIACCAADAVAAVVRVTGAIGDVPARDRWVTVTGTFRRSADDVPELQATSISEVPAPADPYE
jgi:uncharacterized repeat protein (TIGR03943 family)